MRFIWDLNLSWMLDPGWDESNIFVNCLLSSGLRNRALLMKGRFRKKQLGDHPFVVARFFFLFLVR